jgi:hypothetical protein
MSPFQLLLVALFALFGTFLSFRLISARVPKSQRFNPWTSSFSAVLKYNLTDYDCPNCSWNVYSSVGKQDWRPPIGLLDDEAISQENPPILCIPESFGYNTEEANQLFPYKFFPNCSELVSPSKKIASFDRSGIFTMSCDKPTKGKFFIGEKADSEVLGLRTYEKSPETYQKPTNLSEVEYIFATCNQEKEKFLENALYRHRVKSKVLSRPSSSDPIKILMITLDSVSRRSFFRKMPETVKYLNKLNHFQTFDLKIHNVMGEYSANNIMPQLLGDIPYKLHWEIPNSDIFKERAIWTYAKSKNFSTLFIEEGCTNDLARYLGKEINVDHIGTSFWCAARRFNDFENNSQNQRCIGLNNSHSYVYNYIQEFSENYSKYHQWIFTHINTAHESSGLLISTLDLDTVDFLKGFLEKEKNSRTVIFITGDHGMRYGEWFKKMDGSHEHRLPLGLVVASDRLLQSIDFSSEVLDHNSRRLTSKLDLYASQLHLIGLTDGKISRESQEYQEIKRKTSEKYKVISLFMEKAPNNRTCEDVGVPAFWCSCLKFVEVKERFDQVVFKITQALIDSINEEAFRHRGNNLGAVCKKLNLKKIVKVWVLTTDEEFYKIQFEVREKEGVLFESVAVLTWKNYRQRNPSDSYQQVPFFDHGKRTLNIMFVRRVDSYAGKCEDLAKRFSIRPEICIC